MSLEISKQNEEAWKKANQEVLEKLLDQYLVAKDKWKEAWGKPSRNKLQKSYREIEQELYWRIPEDKYRHRGFVLVRGHNSCGLYLQVFTEESFKKSQTFRNKNIL